MRTIVDELTSCSFKILTAQRQAQGEDGQPLFNGGDGGPKMEPMWVMEFTHIDGETRYVVRVPFDEKAKDALLKGLTGGIEVADASAIARLGGPAI